MPKVLKYTKNGYFHRAIDELWLENYIGDKISSINEYLDALYSSYPEDAFEEGGELEEEVQFYRSQIQWLEEFRNTIECLGPETFCELDEDFEPRPQGGDPFAVDFFDDDDIF